MDKFFLILIVIVVIEMIVSGTWQSFYFTMGIPIYKKTATLTSQTKPSPEDLNGLFSQSMAAPILFKQISDNQVAFREALFSFRIMNYTPVMHGLIQYSPGEVQVIGLANWFAPVFIISFIAISISFMGPSGSGLLFVAFPIALFAALYLIQYKRFKKVYDILAGSGAKSM